MTEEFLQFIWKYSLYKKNRLKTSDGSVMDVISAGIQNSDAGPDFFNARIKIGKTVWAGNVEVHLNSSDWIRHNHKNDKAYDNIILHVVYNNDCEITRANGEVIPVFEMDFDKRMFTKYSTLLKSQRWVACEDEIPGIDSLTLTGWLSYLLSERLERKAESLRQIFDKNYSSWEDTLYINIARSFGFNLNALPFELLAKSLPYKYFLKQKNSLFQIEALLFGQAGMLENTKLDDAYYHALQKEYIFLKQKYSLTSIDSSLWKFLRLRPNNFPTLRISQFAFLIYKTSGMFSKIVNAEDINSLEKIFKVEATEYWDTHFIFGKKSKIVKKILGPDAIQSLIINTIIPLLFLYGKIKGQEQFQIKSLHLLEQVKAEKNSIVKKWSELGIDSENAFDTQALLELKKEYCDAKKCLDCRIGMKIIEKISG